VADQEVLAERVHRQRRSHQLGEPDHEQLEIGDALEARQFLADEEVAILARPSAGLAANRRRTAGVLESAQQQARAFSGGIEDAHPRASMIDGRVRSRPPGTRHQRQVA
jgi:hypothetical protein